ncbi:unnamed protein product [Penicillium viridicatum]
MKLSNQIPRTNYLGTATWRAHCQLHGPRTPVSTSAKVSYVSRHRPNNMQVSLVAAVLGPSRSAPRLVPWHTGKGFRSQQHLDNTLSPRSERRMEKHLRAYYARSSFAERLAQITDNDATRVLLLLSVPQANQIPITARSLSERLRDTDEGISLVIVGSTISQRCRHYDFRHASIAASAVANTIDAFDDLAKGVPGRWAISDRIRTEVPSTSWPSTFPIYLI